MVSLKNFPLKGLHILREGTGFCWHCQGGASQKVSELLVYSIFHKDKLKNSKPITKAACS